MALLLSVLFRWQQRQTLNRSGLLLVLGQTAFFFYLLHGHLLLLAAWSLEVSHQRGLPETFIATAGVIGLLPLLPMVSAIQDYPPERMGSVCLDERPEGQDRQTGERSNRRETTLEKN